MIKDQAASIAAKEYVDIVLRNRQVTTDDEKKE